MADNEDLLDYEDDDQQPEPAISNGSVEKKDVRGNYVSIHSSGFRDFLLKPEILRAIIDCGFEHPSEGTYILTSRPTPNFDIGVDNVFASSLQFSTNASRKQYWEWISFARRNRVWVRRRYSFWQLYNSWTLPTTKFTYWLCVIRENWPSKSAKNTKDFRST